MRWTRGYQSEDVEDRRAQGGMFGGGGTPITLLVWLFSRFGLPGLLVGGGLLYLMSSTSHSGNPAVSTREPRADDREASLVQFVSFVFDDAQKTWREMLAQRNTPYRHAHMVLYRDQTSTGCGLGAAVMGPFYCPEDERVYIDLGFYEELRQRFGASGDFAQAYVIAHELGHHVQHLLGLDAAAHGTSSARRLGAKGESVRLELQADCLAGVWARSTEQRNLLEASDMDEALRAAAAIGDDRIQRQDSGHVSPESWSHGSSAQRAHWLRRGFEQGSIDACDTQHADTL